MAQTEKKRDFKVLAEKIAPDNVLIMAELLAIKETKKLVKFMGQHAIRAHATLCTDVFCKDMPDYTLSDKAVRRVLRQIQLDRQRLRQYPLLQRLAHQYGA